MEQKITRKDILLKGTVSEGYFVVKKENGEGFMEEPMARVVNCPKDSKLNNALVLFGTESYSETHDGITYALVKEEELLIAYYEGKNKDV